MSLTREEADQIAKEAIDQGWEGDKHMVPIENSNGTMDEYNEGYGRVHVYDWDDINHARKELGNGIWCDRGGKPYTGCSVELHWPDLMGPKYHVSTTDDWRKLKAKVDEMKEIIKQVGERGWQIPPFTRLQKVGKFGMMISVVPPGGSRVYPVRVGGMRTWHKLCREFDNAIAIAPETHRLQEGQVTAPE